MCHGETWHKRLDYVGIVSEDPLGWLLPCFARSAGQEPALRRLYVDFLSLSKSSTHRIYSRLCSYRFRCRLPASIDCSKLQGQTCPSVTVVPRNNAELILLQNGERNASWRDQNVFKCPTATDRCRGGHLDYGSRLVEMIHRGLGRLGWCEETIL